MMRLLATVFGTAAVTGFLCLPANSQDMRPEPRLTRLAEVLGSLHFLRNLCGESGSAWRDEMEQLLAAESPEPATRARLVAGFNRGYRSFDSVYTACTPAALEAIGRYGREGEAIASAIAGRDRN